MLDLGSLNKNLYTCIQEYATITEKFYWSYKYMYMYLYSRGRTGGEKGREIFQSCEEHFFGIKRLNASEESNHLN